MSRDRKLRGYSNGRRTDVEGELKFGVAASSLPGRLNGSGSESGRMHSRQRVARSVRRGRSIGGRDGAQTKDRNCALDTFLGFRVRSGFVGGPGGGNCGSLKALPGGRRKVLLRSQPLIDLDIAADASSENFALELGNFQLLIGDRVTGVKKGS